MRHFLGFNQLDCWRRLYGIYAFFSGLNSCPREFVSLPEPPLHAGLPHLQHEAIAWCRAEAPSWSLIFFSCFLPPSPGNLGVTLALIRLQIPISSSFHLVSLHPGSPAITHHARQQHLRLLSDKAECLVGAGVRTAAPCHGVCELLQMLSTECFLTAQHFSPPGHQNHNVASD